MSSTSQFAFLGAEAEPGDWWYFERSTSDANDLMPLEVEVRRSMSRIEQVRDRKGVQKARMAERDSEVIRQYSLEVGATSGPLIIHHTPAEYSTFRSFGTRAAKSNPDQS